MIPISSHKKSLEFEINIIPIIDALTILVTFMLAAGVYYSIAMLDVKVSGGASDTVPVQKAAITITVDVDETLAVDVKVTGQETREVRLEAVNAKVDSVRINQELDRLKVRFPQIVTTTLIAKKEVHYQHVVNAMEAIRKTHPDVLLGGF